MNSRLFPLHFPVLTIRNDHETNTCAHFFFIRNSFIRNLYLDGQIAKKLSVLKPQRLRNFYFFFHFHYHNFEDTVTNFDKDMFRKESLCGTYSLQLNEYHI